MFCYQCGTQIPDNSKFCSNCGTQITNVQSSPVSGETNEQIKRKSEPVVAGGIVMCPTCHQTYNAFHNASCPHCSGINRFNFSFSKTKLDTKTIICLVIAAVMLLSMLVLPTFTLESSRTYTISFLGDNYMPMKSTQTTINTLSRIAFIFMLAATGATIIFRITKKTFFSLISSCVNAGVLFFYNVSILGTWMSGGSSSSDRAAILGAGNVLCIGSAIALFVFAFLAFTNEKKENQIKTAPPQPMIFR